MYFPCSFIARTLGMKLFTVFSICRRYEKNGFQLRKDSYAKEKKKHFEDW